MGERRGGRECEGGETGERIEKKKGSEGEGREWREEGREGGKEKKKQGKKQGKEKE